MGTKTLPRLVMGHAIAVSSKDNNCNPSPLHSALQSGTILEVINASRLCVLSHNPGITVVGLTPGPTSLGNTFFSPRCNSSPFSAWQEGGRGLSSPWYKQRSPGLFLPVWPTRPMAGLLCSSSNHVKLRSWASN